MKKCNTCMHGYPGVECVNCGTGFRNYLPYTPPTNADRIRSMNDEELARELLAMYLHGHCDCNEENGICITEQSLLVWLKQSAKEEQR